MENESLRREKTNFLCEKEVLLCQNEFPQKSIRSWKNGTFYIVPISIGIFEDIFNERLQKKIFGDPFNVSKMAN